MAAQTKKRRAPDEVQSIMMRMGKNYVRKLDRICRVNNRSRREIVEILVHEAALELREDPAARINPL